MICVKFTAFFRLVSQLAKLGHPSQVHTQVLVLQTSVDLCRLETPFGQGFRYFSHINRMMESHKWKQCHLFLRLLRVFKPAVLAIYKSSY